MALGGLVDDVVLRTLKPPSTEPLPPYNRTTYILVHGSRLGAGAPHCHWHDSGTLHSADWLSVPVV